MWEGVTQRFQEFNQNLQPTRIQFNDAATKYNNVCKCLNQHYYGINSATDNSILIGSWGKGTEVRPPRDIDLYFVLPVAVYNRFNAYTGNKQSALLQEVKTVLQKTFSTTSMRGDGQVVLVGFSTFDVEVVPAILLTDGRYWICDTHDGGSYTVSNPSAELAYITTENVNHNSNLIPLIKMLKAWQSHCSVPIKSFQLELIAAEFLKQSPWSMKGALYYDWLLRDFFAYLYGKANTTIYVPSTYEPIFLGNAWLSRIETAYRRANKACNYEYFDLVEEAGNEWQKIFGVQIPCLKKAPLLTF